VRKLFAWLTLGVVVLPLTAGAQGAARPATPAQGATKAETKDLNLRAYVELLRSDIRGQKVAIITELMEFTEAEDAAFWPIYRDYELERSAAALVSAR
jgi:hypothetical protein